MNVVVVVIAVLAAQIVVVRPALMRHSDQVLARIDAPRSPAHFVYIGLEVVKSFGLAAGRALLLLGLR